MYKLSLIEWRTKDIMLKIGVFLFCFDKGGFIINLNRPYCESQITRTVSRLI